MSTAKASPRRLPLQKLKGLNKASYKAAHNNCMKKPVAKKNTRYEVAGICFGLFWFGWGCFCTSTAGHRLFALVGSECNPKYRTVFKANHPDCQLVEEDVCVRDFRTLKDRFPPGSIDIYTSGFPCQPWSRLGNRSGTNDPRDADLWVISC